MLLPEIFPISKDIQDEIELYRFIKHYSKNTTLLQFRMKNISSSKQKAQIMKAKEYCHTFGIKLIINSSHKLHQKYFEDGVHLTSNDLMSSNIEEFKSLPMIGASCHNRKEIERAEELQLNYIYLSPVKKTISHPTRKALGWKGFKELVTQTELPTYALGGMKSLDLKLAKKNGAIGIAGINNI
jgi:thiamine-phosphate diphosphorylase